MSSKYEKSEEEEYVFEKTNVNFCSVLEMQLICARLEIPINRKTPTSELRSILVERFPEMFYFSTQFTEEVESKKKYRKIF